VKKLLGSRLQEMKEKNEYLDSITFAGNGEPTLHPEFARIMDDVLELRNHYFPQASITVLSNATLIGDQNIFNTLLKADMNILKLDSAIEETLTHINCPKGNYSLSDILHSMKLFKGRLIIQTLFFRGSYNGITIDNTTKTEVIAWLAALRNIQPESVMIYSIARDTALPGLESISSRELEQIAGQVEALGIRTQVTP